MLGEAREEPVETMASELPSEGSGSLLVTLLEGDEVFGQSVKVGEIVGGQDLALDHREIDLDLVEPGGVSRKVDEPQVEPDAPQALDRGFPPMRRGVIHYPEHTIGGGGGLLSATHKRGPSPPSSLRGKRPAVCRSEVDPPVRPTPRRKSACATYRPSGGWCPTSGRSPCWRHLRRPAALFWRVPPPRRERCGRVLVGGGWRAALWSARCSKDFGWTSLLPSGGCAAHENTIAGRRNCIKEVQSPST